MFSMLYAPACYCEGKHYLWWRWYWKCIMTKRSQNSGVENVPTFIHQIMLSLNARCKLYQKLLKQFTHNLSLFMAFLAAFLHSMNIKWCIKTDLLISWFSTAKHVHVWVIKSIMHTCLSQNRAHDGDNQRSFDMRNWEQKSSCFYPEKLRTWWLMSIYK